MMTSTKRLPLLDLSGPPREIGRAQGEVARALVAHNVALYFHRFAVEGGLSRAEALDRGAQYLAVIERRAPAYAQMMQGLAEASGHHLHEIAALNARYEIMYSEFSRVVMESTDSPGATPASLASGATGPNPAASASQATAADGCTAFAALPEATSDGHLRIGQTWDWIEGVEGLLLRIQYPDGLHVLTFTEAGIVGGKIGLNSAGIGLVINGLVSNHDSWARLHTPFHVRTWAVLNSRTLEEAQSVLLDEDRSCSANFLLAHLSADGHARILDLETSPFAVATVYPNHGLVAHANHFLDPEPLDLWQPIDDRSSTFQRCARMRSLLETHHGRLDDARLQAILADHDGAPLGICTHHNDLWPPDESYVTVLSAILDLHARQLLVAPGNACTTPFERVSLSA